jgi:hypothetical protein
VASTVGMMALAAMVLAGIAADGSLVAEVVAMDSDTVGAENLWACLAHYSSLVRFAGSAVRSQALTGVLDRLD